MASELQDRAKVLVTVVPFGELDPRPLTLLESAGIRFRRNPYGRKLREDEVAPLLEGIEVLLASTEPLTAPILAQAPQLRLIAKVGIGLDNVDLAEARRRGISVTYTPDAPSPAVAELVVGQMIAALRQTGPADRNLRSGVWKRRIGRRLSQVTVGVVGVGRIGTRVLSHLQSFGPPRLLINDLCQEPGIGRRFGATWVEKPELFRRADIVSLHVPLTARTRGLVDRTVLESLPDGAVLINTSRGGVVDEDALYRELRRRPDLSAVLDVFGEEPYRGPLAQLENVLLTCHMGSCSRDCRVAMEMGAATEVVRYFAGREPLVPVPDSEVDNQKALD